MTKEYGVLCLIRDIFAVIGLGCTLGGIMMVCGMMVRGSVVPEMGEIDDPEEPPTDSQYIQTR